MKEPTDLPPGFAFDPYLGELGCLRANGVPGKLFDEIGRSEAVKLAWKIVTPALKAARKMEPGPKLASNLPAPPKIAADELDRISDQGAAFSKLVHEGTKGFEGTSLSDVMESAKAAAKLVASWPKWKRDLSQDPKATKENPVDMPDGWYWAEFGSHGRVVLEVISGVAFFGGVTANPRHIAWGPRISEPEDFEKHVVVPVSAWEAKLAVEQKYLNALAEIEEWKDASGLIDSHGDPDGITPKIAKSYWEELAGIKWMEGQLRNSLTLIADMLGMTGSFDLGYDVPREVKSRLGLLEDAVSVGDIRRAKALRWGWVDKSGHCSITMTRKGAEAACAVMDAEFPEDAPHRLTVLVEATALDEGIDG